MQSSQDDGSWIKEELSPANFSDIKLNKRFSVVAKLVTIISYDSAPSSDGLPKGFSI